MSQLTMFPDDLSNERVFVGISGGINSAAVLCYLASEYPEELKPKEIHLYYVHIKEHSPDTLKFALSVIRYALCKFDTVRWCVNNAGSVIEYFRREKMIPHPILSPCSIDLKIIPIEDYKRCNGLTIDLVGFVRNERKRIKRQLAKEKNITNRHLYPIFHMSDDDCIALVKREIGWYPAIYDIKENGKRVFTHNNCLPCKNMSGYMDGERATKGFLDTKTYYPGNFNAARSLAVQLNNHYGRNDNDDFDGDCEICKF